MPNKKFLEKFPLYRKFKWPFSRFADDLSKPAINMACPNCHSDETFNMANEYSEGWSYSNVPIEGKVFRCAYLCSSCQKFNRYFFLKFDDEGESVMKIGQYPSWDIEGNKNVEDLLGSHARYYKQGLICESQGYGIGAFSYYRRIVEEIINSLLNQISELMSDDELKKYNEALKKTQQTTVTAEKIELVKDLLPSILRPAGMNPLNTLHQILSEGLHAKNDEKCLEDAIAIREILIFLVSQVTSTSRAKRNFTDRMKNLLEKKSK